MRAKLLKFTQIQLLIDLARQMQGGMHESDENMNPTEMKCLGIAVAAWACEGFARLVLNHVAAPNGSPWPAA